MTKRKICSYIWYIHNTHAPAITHCVEPKSMVSLVSFILSVGIKSRAREMLKGDEKYTQSTTFTYEVSRMLAFSVSLFVMASKLVFRWQKARMNEDEEVEKKYNRNKGICGQREGYESISTASQNISQRSAYAEAQRYSLWNSTHPTLSIKVTFIEKGEKN